MFLMLWVRRKKPTTQKACRGYPLMAKNQARVNAERSRLKVHLAAITNSNR